MTLKKVKTMREGKGRFINRPSKTGKKFYDRFFIYVPTEVARDGTFPFKAGDGVAIQIKDDELIIRKPKVSKQKPTK